MYLPTYLCYVLIFWKRSFYGFNFFKTGLNCFGKVQMFWFSSKFGSVKNSFEPTEGQDIKLFKITHGTNLLDNTK